MGDLTANFSRAEFDIHEPVPPEYAAKIPAHAQWLQALRDRLSARLGRPVPGLVTSCYRSLARNQAIYANVSNAAALPAYMGSEHLTADADDVEWLGASNRDIIGAIVDPSDITLPPFHQCIVYDDQPHLHVGYLRGPDDTPGELLRGYLDAQGARHYMTIAGPNDVPALSPWGVHAILIAAMAVGASVALWGFLQPVIHAIA